jgi:transcriptional regulator with XRE-family HTH domain
MKTVKPMKQYMDENNLTQSEMADALDVTPGAISKAVIAKRRVYLNLDGSGNISDALEVVKFGRGKRDSTKVEG